MRKRHNLLQYIMENMQAKKIKLWISKRYKKPDNDEMREKLYMGYRLVVLISNFNKRYLLNVWYKSYLILVVVNDSSEILTQQKFTSRINSHVNSFGCL